MELSEYSFFSDEATGTSHATDNKAPKTGAYSTRLHEEYIELIKVLAVSGGESQRRVIQRALKSQYITEGGDMKDQWKPSEEDLQKALK